MQCNRCGTLLPLACQTVPGVVSRLLTIPCLQRQRMANHRMLRHRSQSCMGNRRWDRSWSHNSSGVRGAALASSWYW